MAAPSKIIIKHFFRPEQKVVRQLPVYYPPSPLGLITNDSGEMSIPSEQKHEDKLDLNGYLISHPSSTFFVKLAGDALPHLGLYPGDLLIIDQTLEVHDGNLVVGVMQEAFFTAFIKIKNKQLYLAGELNDPDRLITPDLKCSIWGVVSHVIHKPAMKPSLLPKKKTPHANSEISLTETDSPLAIHHD